MSRIIAYTWSESILCGGTIVPATHVRYLRKLGYDARIYCDLNTSKDQQVLEELATVPFRSRSDLLELTPDDVLINVWWRTIPEESKLAPRRKIQFLQGNDAAQYENVELKENVARTRQYHGWESMAVSQYAGEWTGLKFALIPNGVHERFLKQDWPKERDIDVLIEGSGDDTNKNVPYAISLAKEAGAKKIVWLGRSTPTVKGDEGVEKITDPEQSVIPGIYARAKVFLKLSHSEGFCLPILEAMACGALVVTWPMGGNDFCKDKVNCVSSKDFQLKTHVIASILENVYPKAFEEIRKAARRTAESYSWDNSIKLLSAFLDVE